LAKIGCEFPHDSVDKPLPIWPYCALLIGSVGRIPKWPTGADCKSAGLRLRWFESSSYHHSLPLWAFSHLSTSGNSLGAVRREKRKLPKSRLSRCSFSITGDIGSEGYYSEPLCLNASLPRHSRPGDQAHHRRICTSCTGNDGIVWGYRPCCENIFSNYCLTLGIPGP
jgi:hypothetical protein